MLLMTAGAFGCASRRAGPAEDLGTRFSTLPNFVRQVTPFEVRDGKDEPYAHPFLGGLNLPRPQLIDIDADGDLDLFVQERSNEIIFFERVGDPKDLEFVWRTDRYQDLAVGEWNRFVDLDQDGDLDLLSEKRFSYVRYYRNDGTPTVANFVIGADSLKDASGEPIFSDRQNIPNVTDIDCDGKLDLFIGRLTGTVMRYEATDTRGADVPRFQLITERFEDIEIVAQFGSRHGANTLAFADFDNDGDQDLFWGDFFEPGLLLIENTGTCARPAMRDEPIPFPSSNPVQTSGYNAPTLGDLDGDGDHDMVMGVLGGAFNPNLTSVDNLYMLTHRDGGVFTVENTRLISNIDVGSESIPSLVDWDGDGDLDLLVGNKIDPSNLRTSLVYRFENVGSITAPVFHFRDTLDFTGQYHYAPAFADLDADGDLDLVLGSWRDRLALYRNTGSASAPQFELEDSVFVKITRGTNTAPALVDIDNDGDQDLFIGEASGALNFYRNNGTPERPDFVLESDTYGEIDIGRRSFPTFLDIDNDGDQDLVFGTESAGLLLYRNEGTRTEPSFVLDENFEIRADGFSTPAFGDIDGDGDEDLFVGGVGGGLLFYERR